MVEYRAVPDSDRVAYNRMRDYAFRPADGIQEYDSQDDSTAELAARRGLYEDDELQCICGYHDFTVRFRGNWYGLGGVSSVATPPENRRGGFVRRLLTDLLAEFRDEDVYFSALWPFSYEFYRKLGWATVQKHTEYEFSPDALSFTADRNRGEFVRIEKSDYERVVPAYEQYLDSHQLATRRTDEWWRHRVFDHWRQPPYVYAWESDGDVRGYLSYVVSRADDHSYSRTMRVREFVYADHEARVQLLRFLHNHDSQMDSVKLRTRNDTTLLDLVPDPRAVDCEIVPGPMFRVVDVEAALSEIPYPADASGSVVLDVSDSICHWNDGTFTLEFADGEATCRSTDGADPDASVDITTLSQLTAGYMNPHDASTFGTLDIADESAITALDAAFPTYPIDLPENF